MSVLAIVGPTASGKSRLAVDIAVARTEAGHATELVAVDAFTVYRRMDVGTAKPSAEDRRRVPHHLIDVADPGEELTVATFQRLARGAIAEVRSRGVTPLLVGGSGLYWRAVVDDLRFPPTDAGTRAAIEQRWGDDQDGAHAHLASIDPAAAGSIAPENLRRTVRALEVIELTGERFSTFSEAWDRFDSVLPGLRVGYLEPDTTRLRAAIDTRAREMVDNGLVAEAEQLRASGPLSRTAAQAIGYAEAFAVLDGHLDVDVLAPTIATRTWRYAKRQRSWFRADPRCVPTAHDELRRAWSQAG